MNPFDFQSLVLSKDTVGQFYSGGAFTFGAPDANGKPAARMVWDVPVTLSTHLAAKTVLIGSFQQSAQIFRRQGLTIEISNSNKDDFEKGIYSIRSETRLALTVPRPIGFCVVSLN